MKNLGIFLAIGLGAIFMSACSGYDLDEELNLPPVDNNNNTPDNPNKNDEWETTKDDWFNMANGIIDSHKETNLSHYVVNVPFTASLGEDMFFSFDSKTNVEFKSLENIATVTPSYGEWYGNNESDSIRTITTSQNFDTNIYNRSLTVTTGEAYRLLNGKRENFLMPTLVNTSYGVSLDDSIRVERNDSIIDKFTFTDYVVINFVDKGAIRNDLQPVKVTAKTVIEIFVGIKEKNNDMPEPNIKVGEEIVSITDRTASPIYVSQTQINWSEVSLDKTTDKVYVIVNGQLKDTWKNSELASVDWCNSAVYDTVLGRWIPCHLAMDTNNTGWSYTFQLADGTARKLDAPMNAALISSLKSFKKDNDASQTPFLTKGVQKRNYSDGPFYTVPGIYTYTVAHK